MKGVVFLGDRKLEVREFPDPTPGPRDVILEIKASGMCGSDLHNYRAPANAGGAVTGGIKREAGMIAGHEPCGVVAAVGAGVTEKEARVGQRVMDHHYDGCGNCKHCRAGWTQMCLAGTVVYGSGGHGGHAKYMKVPVSTLVPLPDVFVLANYKETQLTHMGVGQTAAVTVDSYPGVKLTGHVLAFSPATGSQFSLLPPDNATGNFTKVVQRVSVKITIDQPNPLSDLLRPGMSVIATVDTGSPITVSPAP